MDLRKMLLASKLGGVGGVNLHEMLIAQKLFGEGGSGGGGGGESASYTYPKIIDRTISGVYTNAVATTVGNYAFYNCTGLVAVNFPKATSINYATFMSCSEMVTADFSAATSIGTNAFFGCGKLTALILRSETVCTLQVSNPFTSTPISSGTGYIYVPSALVDTYKAATNWSKYASRFRAIEDYPEICGGAS